MESTRNNQHLEKLSDEELWSAYVAGSCEAFSEVRRRHQDALFRYLVLSLSDVGAAAVALARVLGLAAAYRKPYEGFDSLKVWLFAIATQQAASPQTREEQGLTQFISELRRPDANGRQEMLMRALADMQRDIKQPFLLVTGAWLSVSEAAKACCYTVERTRRCVERAYKEISASLPVPED